MALDCLGGLGGENSKCLGGPIQCIIILICLVYIISPIDFIPDVIPFVGWIDDGMAAVVALVTAFSAIGGNIFGKMGGIFK